MPNTYIVENDFAADSGGSSSVCMDIQAPSDQAVEIIRVEWGLRESGAPSDEMWRIRFLRITAISTGGETPVPRPLSVNMPASGSTISSNAAVGTFGDTLFDHNFHVQAGFVYNPQEDERFMVAGGDTIGWFVENNDTALAIGFMVVFAEL